MEGKGERLEASSEEILARGGREVALGRKGIVRGNSGYERRSHIRPPNPGGGMSPPKPIGEPPYPGGGPPKC